MAVMDLLADPVTVAGAVSLDVEVPVSGVRRIRTGPQNGREPTACSGSQRCENSHFPLVLGFSNRKDFAVREFETGNIHRQATRMGAELATNLMIAVATHEARPGVDRPAVRWSITNGDPRQLCWEWNEHDGPPVELPSREGFGSRLLKRVLTVQTGADVRIHYDPNGLRVTVAIPLQGRLTA
jgi:hypothetical protein